MTTMEQPLDEQHQDEAPETPRARNKRELAQAIADRHAAEAEEVRLYRESESLGVSVREMSNVLNAHPGVPYAQFSTWGRRRATACGRKQARKPVVE